MNHIFLLAWLRQRVEINFQACQLQAYGIKTIIYFL